MGAQIKILVIGDTCIDKFVYCDIERICPEAPVPILKPKYDEENYGMARNVVANLVSLGAHVDAITNINRIDKIRFVDARSGQMVVRVDENDKADRIKLTWSGDEDEYDVVVISDYNKGFLTKDDIYTISQMYKCPIFLDTKKKLEDWWIKDITFIKINEFEYKKNYEIPPDYDNFSEKMIVTHGSKGCEFMGNWYSVPEVSVKDVSGAGDTFLAGLAFAYVKTGKMPDAIKFANDCSTKIVQIRGVSSDLSDMKL